VIHLGARGPVKEASEELLTLHGELEALDAKEERRRLG
jgi:hypothetical protein